MKGKLKKINEKWFVEYTGISYSGGNPKQLGSYTKKVEQKRLEFTPNNQRYLNCFLYVDKDTRVDFKEVFINPMGREVDPNDLGQNHSSCVWYAELTYEEDENSPGYNHQVKLVKDLANEIKFEDVFNDKKKEKVKEVINQHKVLKELSLVNPLHLRMTSDGYGEFPDGYKLTEKGIQYIIEKLNKEEQKEIENDWEEILFDFIDFYPCILPHELFEWLAENYEIPKKKNGKD